MLKVQELIKVYPGPVPALRGINLEIDRGMFGLLGPNGAGKSTLMNIVAGLLEPTSGSVTLFDEDIVSQPQKVWDQLGYLPQEFGFYANLSGRDMLVYLLKLKGVTAPQGIKWLADELLERVNLSFAARRKVKTYSGGMKQRLGIAQAIAGDPRLIVVDEPTAGLDPEERLRFYRILAELAADRIVVLSTHIVEDVANLCSRFAVIGNGKILALTTPTQATQEFQGTLFEGEASADQLNQIRKQHRIARAILVEGQNRVRIQATTSQIPAGFESVDPTLEDAYLLLMQNDKAMQSGIAS